MRYLGTTRFAVDRNRKVRFRGIGLGGAFLILVGCSEEPPPVLRVGDVGVPATAVGNLAELERQALADLIAFGAAVSAASTDSLIEPVVRRETEDEFVTALPVHLGATALGTSDQQLRDAYATAPEWELVVRHVVRLAGAGDPRAVADSARAVANEVASRAASGTDFAALAAEFSEEPGAARRGGLLEPGRRGSWVEPFWAAASMLQPGDISPVVQTEYGFHVIRLEERRPVPFEEADRTALLRRVVATDVAAVAMEGWAATDGAVLLDPPALQEAHARIVAGVAIPDSLVVATGGSGGFYRGIDLAAGWATLDVEERVTLERGDLEPFARWVERDARSAIWADRAASMGVVVGAGPATSARLDWQSRLLGWVATFGFQPGLDHAEIVAVARQALLSGAPEARAARADLRGLRFLLRSAYPVVDLGLGP